MRLGLLCGSLGPASSNAAALAVVGERSFSASVRVDTLEGLADLPAFDPATTDDPPPPVRTFRQDLDEVDALVIAAPEYAAGVSGSLKNALDWLVGSATLDRLPIAVISAGTTGGTRAVEQLVFTLSWQGAYPLATLGIEAPATKMTDGVVTDPTTRAQLNELADRFVATVEGTAEERARVLRSVVEPYGIDPARFGDIT